MNWNKVKIEYNPTLPGNSMWRCPYCGCYFYGGGPALHNNNCLKEVDYEEMVYILSPMDVKILRTKTGRCATFDGLNIPTLAKSEIGKLLGF